MGSRTIDPKLKALYDAGDEVYSISRLNTIHQCPYQAYLNYVKHVPQQNNVWALLGSRIHDALQACVDTGCSTEIIHKAILEELDDLEIEGVDFPLDRNGGTSIRDNWITNMTNFAQNFQTPSGKFETEQLILYPVKPHVWMQGYIDLIRYNKDGSLYIIDWKTSSNFTKQHLIEAGRQLLLYSMAKEAEGYNVKRISWVMLKYCETSWTLKNSKIKTKVSEWRNLIKDLKSPIASVMKDLGYDEIDTEYYYLQAMNANSIEMLPEDVQKRFQIKIYVRDYELTDDLKNECMTYINDTINMYQSLDPNNESEWLPCDIKSNAFFCSSLCGYGGKSEKCKYWMDYCKQFMGEDDEEDMF